MNQVGAITDRAVSVDTLQLKSLFATNAVGEVVSDLRYHTQRIDIFESIMSPTLTGTITIQDNTNLSSAIPLVGLELLNVGFSISDKRTGSTRKYQVPMAIYGQQNRIPINKGTELYTLGLASPEFISSVGRKVSFGFVNQKVENIIRSLVTSPQYLGSQKPLHIQATSTPTSLVVPYDTPFDIIRWLTLSGVSENGESNYVFFETLEGFHFVSIASLIRNSYQQDIPTIRMELAGTREYGNSKDLLFADQIDMVSGFDHLYLLSHGYFASMTCALDLLSGVYGVTTSSSGSTQYQGKPKLNRNGQDLYPPVYAINSNPTAKMFLVPTTQYSAANTTLRQQDRSIRDNLLAKTIAHRYREWLGLQSRCVRVRLPGTPELNVGKVVHIVMPSPLNNNTFTDQHQDIATGRYLIVNAQHSLVSDTRGGFYYETTIEAVTDSIR